MKRIIGLLLATLLTITTCFSQTISPKTNVGSIVFITSEQLKYTNLIFLEHEKVITENKLLNVQINNMEKKLRLEEQIDSLRSVQYSQCENLNKVYYSQIQNLKEHITKKDETILRLRIGCITVGVGAILLLILK